MESRNVGEAVEVSLDERVKLRLRRVHGWCRGGVRRQLSSGGHGGCSGSVWSMHALLCGGGPGSADRPAKGGLELGRDPARGALGGGTTWKV